MQHWDTNNVYPNHTIQLHSPFLQQLHPRQPYTDPFRCEPITTHAALSEPIPRPDHKGTSCVRVLVHATSRTITSLLTAPCDKP
jgi:hypothetical protein